MSKIKSELVWPYGSNGTRAILQICRSIEVVGVNDLTDTGTLAHLFVDSSQGTFGQVKADGDELHIDRFLKVTVRDQ